MGIADSNLLFDPSFVSSLHLINTPVNALNNDYCMQATVVYRP